MKKIQLSIPTPCHENWENMTPVEKGRYCSSCQKQVVDFSSMSDREIAAFFKKPSAGATCGRFLNDQLNRDIVIPRKRIPWVKYFFQFVLPAFLISIKAHAQDKNNLKNKVEEKALCTKRTGFIDPKIKVENINVVGDTIAVIRGPMIKGKIIDETGREVPNATIKILQTGLTFATDSLGRFELNRNSVYEKFTLEVSSIGYETKATDIFSDIKKENGEIIICLKPQLKKLDEVFIKSNGSTRLGGSVGVVCVRYTFYQQIKDWLIPGRDSIKIYPNPINKGNNFQIQFNLKDVGEYVMNVFDLNGRQIMNKQISISRKDQTENLIADQRFY